MPRALALLLLAACSTSTPPAPTAPPPPAEAAVDTPEPAPAAPASTAVTRSEFAAPDEHGVINVRLGELPPTLPTPFTTEQIRDGMPLGSQRVFQITDATRPPVHTIWEVVGHTADDATLKYIDTLGDRAPVTRERASRWTDLRDHGSFPAMFSTRSEDRVKVPGGTFDTWRYDIREMPGRVMSFWFAKDLPGPPVLHTVTLDGKETFRMELQSYRTGG